MMRRFLTLGCVLALAFPLVACDGGDEPMDDAGTGTDSGPMMVDLDPVGTGEVGMPLMAADFSCLGSATAPAGGTDQTFTVTAEDFFSGEIVEGLTVHFFPDNVVTEGCTGTCQTLTTDASGQASVTAPGGGWYAYRIQAGEATHMSLPESYVTAVQINEEAPTDAGNETLNAVRQSTITTLTSVLLINQQVGTSIVTGLLYDCNGDAVANARVRVFAGGEEVTFGRASTGPKSFYFNGESFPNATQSETNVDGLYGAGNIAIPGDGQLRIELWGVLEEGGEMQMLGCETADAVADGITIVNVGPTRSDGPSGCSG